MILCNLGSLHRRRNFILQEKALTVSQGNETIKTEQTLQRP